MNKNCRAIHNHKYNKHIDINYKKKLYFYSVEKKCVREENMIIKI